MKLSIVVVTTSACAVQAALSTKRMGPRRLVRTRGDVAIEFGRTVDLVDAGAALRETKFAAMRYLLDASFSNTDGGLSFSYQPGLSFTYPAMSFSYPAMSFSYPAMSLSFGVQSPTTAPKTISVSPSFVPSTGTVAPVDSPTRSTSIDTEGSQIMCTPQNWNTSSDVYLQIDVDSMNHASNSSLLRDLLSNLAQQMANHGEIYFGICPLATTQDRMLLLLSEHQTAEATLHNNSAVTGLDATITPATIDGNDALESCTPETEGALCTVANVILTVYSESSAFASEAQEQVRHEIVKQLTAQSFSSGDIIAVRLHHDNTTTNTDFTDATQIVAAGEAVGLTSGHSGSDKSAPPGSMNRAILISVVTTLAVLVLAVMAFAYLKKKANRPTGNDSSRSDASSTNYDADDITPETKFSDSLPERVYV